METACRRGVKTIGLIGGMSWESTAAYYDLLNKNARDSLGGLHSADIVLRSLDFAVIARLQTAGDWNAAAEVLANAARDLEKGGAECVLICANTMHKCADAVSAAVKIPLIHIADSLAAAIQKSACRKPLLLGTRYTMEDPFYRDYLRDRHEIAAQIPDEESRRELHRIIYEELCRGEIRADSKRAFLEIVARCKDADGIIFGCTEIGMLVSESDFILPCFDTTKLHTATAMRFALKN